MTNSSDQIPQQTIPELPKPKKNNLFIVIFLVIGIAICAVFLFNYVQKSDDSDEVQEIEEVVVDPEIQTSLDNNQIALKVGDEYIYTTTFDAMLTELLPLGTESENTPEKRKKVLTEKIIKDSITLQLAKKEGLVQLDSSFYNAETIDFDKRVEALNTIIESFNDMSYETKGSVVAIWFYNMKVGKLGLEEGKKLAYETIKPLYDSVKTGEMTMEEAGEAIRANKKLAQIDPVYKENAYLAFKEGKQGGATFDKEFNAKIKSLKPGGITELTLIKDNIDRAGYVEAVYMFAKLDEKKMSQYENYDDWIIQNKDNYKVTVY